MAEHANAAIHIGQLHLRMPGTSADTVHRVVNSMGQRLAQHVPTGAPRRFGALSVRVHVSASATEAEISDAIAKAIQQALWK